MEHRYEGDEPEPGRFTIIPFSAQTRYLNINGFAYPASWPISLAAP